MTDAMGDEEVFQGSLRKGYYMRVGDKMITGPRKVTMDRETARKHLHMMENCGELKRRLGIQQPSFRRKKLSDIGARSAPTGPAFDSVVEAAVEREIARVLPGIVDEEVAKRLAGGGNSAVKSGKRTRAGRS